MADAPPEDQDILPPVGDNPESQLSDFYLNPSLSDIKIKNPDDDGIRQ